MKWILALLAVFATANAFSQTASDNKLFGSSTLNIANSDTLRPPLSMSQTEIITLFKTMEFQSGKIHVICDASQMQSVAGAGNLGAVKKAMKNCDHGVVVILEQCVSRDLDGNNSKPFNQVINVK